MSFDDRLAWCEANLPGFRVKKKIEGEGVSQCQLHEDDRPSLWVGWQAPQGAFHCLGCGEKGTMASYAARLGKPTWPVPGGQVQEWDYKTPAGSNLLRVTRSMKDGRKTFWQSRWDGSTWVKGGLGKAPAPLLYAPELAAAKTGQTVFLVEGEKCAQRLIEAGQLATTAPEGAGKFGKVGREYLDLLLPLGVVILPDQDKPGFDHALQVARRLRSEQAQEAKILLLPGLTEKQDVFDWLETRPVKDLLDLVPTALTLERFEEVARREFPVKPELDLVSDPGPNPWESNPVPYPEQSQQPPQTQWEPPLPIELTPEKPEFPIDAFPPDLAEYAKQVAASIQVPLDLVALDIISVIGTALQKRVDIDTGRGAVFPLNIWTLSVYPSGGGKSRALAEVSYPLDEWENSLADKVACHNDQAQYERQEPEQRISELLKIKSRSSDEEAELRQLRGRLKDFAELPLPSIYSTDLTQEALLTAMAENNGHHSVLNAEASDFFQIMAGRYSKEGQSAFGFFVSAYSQEIIKCKRVMNGSKSIDKPTLSMGLSVQPSVFDKTASNQEFVTRGLLARFLLAYPSDLRGGREVDPPPIEHSVRCAYNAMVRSLTRIEPSRDERKQFIPYRVSLKMEARQELLAFRRWAENSMSSGGVFSEVGKEFAARLSEHVAKIIGILHCSIHPDQPWETCVDRSTVESAAKIVRWSSEHVLMTLGLGRTAEYMARAAYLHERISAHSDWLQRGSFSVRALQQAVKRKERYKSGGVEALERDLSFLESLGYVQRIDPPKGGSRSAIYRVSPFFSQNGPQGPQHSSTPDKIRVSTGDHPSPQWSPGSPNRSPILSATPELGSKLGSLWTTGVGGGPQRKPICNKGLNGTGDLGDQNRVLSKSSALGSASFMDDEEEVFTP